VSDYKSGDRYQRGVELMNSIAMNPDGMDAIADANGAVGPDVARMLGEFCFGDVWTHGPLDLRTKRVITLATISALGRERQLRGHIAGALAQGFTREEIQSIFVHQFAYGGFPMGLSGLQVAAEVFASLDAEDDD
jgi:4-carboxymuconolactone decarboxylase